jgi:hypothetical protein
MEKSAAAGILARGRQFSPGMSASSLIGTREHQTAIGYLAYPWRTTGELLANSYPTPIRHLSDTYPTPGEYAANA